MSTQSDNCFKEQNHSNCNINQSNNTSAVDTKTESYNTAHSITSAEYIYNTMIPPVKSPMDNFEDTEEQVVELGASLGKQRERCNTGGSSKSGGRLMSMDLSLQPEDVELDGGLALLLDGGSIHMKSSDMVKDLFLPDAGLPDSAATAAAALQAGGGDEAYDDIPLHQPTKYNAYDAPLHNGASDERKPAALLANREQRDMPDNFCPILNLTARLERISTGEEIAPLKENFRISSSDWVRDFDGKNEGNLGPMHPSLFMDNTTSSNPNAENQQSSTSHLSSSDWVRDLEGENEGNLGPMHPSLFMEYTTSSNPNAANQQPSTSPLPLNPSYDSHDHSPSMPSLSPNAPQIVQNLPPLTTRSTTTSRLTDATSPPSSTTSKTSKKRKKKRMIDESVAVEPTDDDVLFGRGGYTNTHRGNLRFRAEALELRAWYAQPNTTKEEKYRISDLLVESVKAEGHRFLEKGDDGLWHEVIGNGARKKASQALRERLKGTPRGRAGGHASSIKSAGSTSLASQGGGEASVDEIIGDIMPAMLDVNEIVGV